MSQITQPYKTSNQKILRSSLRNRKLADLLIDQIFDLQTYASTHGGTIVNWIMPAGITASTQSQYAIDSVKIKAQLAKALCNDYLSGRIINLIRELQLLASITPIAPLCTYKHTPSKANVLKLLISTLANTKFGTLMQQALLELQVQFNIIFPGTAAVKSQFHGQVAGMTTDVTIDPAVAGVIGNAVLAHDSIKTVAQMVAAWNAVTPSCILTVSAGDDTQVPTADITLVGGLDANPMVDEPRFQ